MKNCLDDIPFSCCAPFLVPCRPHARHARQRRAGQAGKGRSGSEGQARPGQAAWGGGFTGLPKACFCQALFLSSPTIISCDQSHTCFLFQNAAAAVLKIKKQKSSKIIKIVAALKQTAVLIFLNISKMKNVLIEDLCFASYPKFH